MKSRAEIEKALDEMRDRDAELFACRSLLELQEADARARHYKLGFDSQREILLELVLALEDIEKSDWCLQDKARQALQKFYAKLGEGK
jgi:hypothetical protein